MNVRSLKLIREVIINSGKWTSIEVSQDSIYLQFKDVELGTPKSDDSFSLVVRFAEDSFFTVFYKTQTLAFLLELQEKLHRKAQCLTEKYRTGG